MQRPNSQREVAAHVPMPRLLEALGFQANERTRRNRCILHGGSNPTTFAWREDGRWRCFSCGTGGDKIALVRAVRGCSFPEALKFLAALAGVEYRPIKLSRAQLELARATHERAEQTAWRIRDEVVRLRSYYGDGLRRVERLLQRIGWGFPLARDEAEREDVWRRLARLAPAATYFLAAHEFLNRADAALLVRLALSEGGERRAMILGEHDANAAKVA